MKITLVYSPFTWPTGMPLGISYLKAYLKSADRQVRVKAMDLNLGFFKRQAKQASNLCPGCPKQFSKDCLPAHLFSRSGYLEELTEFFQHSQDFFKKDIYAQKAHDYRVFFEQIQDCYRNLLVPFLEDDGNYPREKTVLRLLREDVKAILRTRPDIIGFSANINQAYYSLALAKIIKRKTGIPVVFGGYFVSCLDPKEIMRAFPFLDFIIHKEGEKGLFKLLQSIPLRKYSGVPNLFYRKNNRIIANPEQAIENLDSVPFPDYSDFKPRDYLSIHPVFPVLYSRGCYWKKCAFCANLNNYSPEYRIRSTQNMLRELQSLEKRYRAKYFLFCDEQISAHSLERLSEEITGAKLKIYYGISGLKPGDGLNKDILEKAYKSGCRWIYFGVESLSQRLLDLMSKGTKAEQVLQIISWCRQIGITPFSSYMLGFPTQTKDDIAREVRLCKKQKIPFSVPDDGIKFILMRGSGVHRQPEKFRVEPVKTPPFLKTATGSIKSGILNYKLKSGLTPEMAKELFSRLAQNTLQYESGSFWEHFVLLGERRIKLLFSREDYSRKIESGFYNRIARAINSGVRRAKNDADRFLGYYYSGISYQRGKSYQKARQQFSKARRLVIKRKLA